MGLEEERGVVTASQTVKASTATRRRPRDRRAQILHNASELFTKYGFHAVRMEDIAEATDVTARAIYRHFANKQDLLSQVVLEDQDRLLMAAQSAERSETGVCSLEELLTRMVEASLESLRLGPLWQREARHLTADDFERVREGTRRIGGAVRRAIEKADPSKSRFGADVRAWMAVSIITSPGHYDRSLSQRRLSPLLVSAALAAINTPECASASPESRDAPAAEAPVANERPGTSRREQIIAAAARAFRERGFGGVSLDEFGIAGPAVYRYFDSKADILSAMIIRVQEWMALESSRAMHHSASDEQVIDGLVRGYVRIATEATDLFAVSVTEALNLPASATERDRRIRQDDLAEWVKWLRTSRSEVTEADALALVNAVRTALNDLVRIPHLSRHAEFPDELVACSMNALLNTPMPSARSGRRRDE